MHALVIEPDFWTAMMIEDALGDLGYSSVDIAVTLMEAVQMATQRCPNLITTNVAVDLTDALESVRTVCSGSYVPFVVMTATGAEGEQQPSDFAVITKPFTVPAFRAAVAMAVALAQNSDP